MAGKRADEPIFSSFVPLVQYSKRPIVKLKKLNSSCVLYKAKARNWRTLHLRRYTYFVSVISSGLDAIFPCTLLTGSQLFQSICIFTLFDRFPSTEVFSNTFLPCISFRHLSQTLFCVVNTFCSFWANKCFYIYSCLTDFEIRPLHYILMQSININCQRYDFNNFLTFSFLSVKCCLAAR